MSIQPAQCRGYVQCSSVRSTVHPSVVRKDNWCLGPRSSRIFHYHFYLLFIPATNFLCAFMSILNLRLDWELFPHADAHVEHAFSTPGPQYFYNGSPYVICRERNDWWSAEALENAAVLTWHQQMHRCRSTKYVIVFSTSASTLKRNLQLSTRAWLSRTRLSKTFQP